MTQQENGNKGVPTVLFVLALTAFVPVAGLLPGLLLVGYGIGRGGRRGKRLALLAGVGCTLTPALYIGLFAMLLTSMDDLFAPHRAVLAPGQLAGLVRDVEYYRIVNETYPATLAELRVGMASVDPWAGFPGEIVSAQPFYERSPDGDTYVLRSLGEDGLPYTTDDIVPVLSERERAALGYRDRLSGSGGVK